MGKPLDLTNYLYRLTEWIMNLSIINLLWLFFNAPFIFVVFHMLLTGQFSLLWILCSFILFCLLFYPATIAMFASVRDCVINKGKNASIKKYWRFYKADYLKSLLIGFLMSCIWMVWCINIFYFLEKNIVAAVVFLLIIGILKFVFNINLFNLSVHYYYNFIELFKNSFIITFGSLHLFITILVGSVFVFSFSILMSKTIFTLFIVFFTGSLFALVSFTTFYKYYLKYSSDA